MQARGRTIFMLSNQNAVERVDEWGDRENVEKPVRGPSHMSPSVYLSL